MATVFKINEHHYYQHNRFDVMVRVSGMPWETSVTIEFDDYKHPEFKGSKVVGLKEITHIPLKDIEFERLGFEYVEGKYVNGEISIAEDYQDVKVFNGMFLMDGIKYLHDLQRFYYNETNDYLIFS